MTLSSTQAARWRGAVLLAAIVAGGDQAETGRWLDLAAAELAPAQAEVLRLMVATLRGPA